MNSIDRHWMDRLKLTQDSSDDPRTQTAAVIADGKRFIACGANKLPHGVTFKPERVQGNTKYLFIEHAERVAIAAAGPTSLVGAPCTPVCIPALTA